MTETDTNANRSPTRKKERQRRLLASGAGALIASAAAGALVAGAVPGALLTASASTTRSHATVRRVRAGPGFGQPGPGGGALHGGPGGTPPAVSGTVESVDTSAGTLTVKEQAGATVRRSSTRRWAGPLSRAQRRRSCRTFAGPRFAFAFSPLSKPRREPAVPPGTQRPRLAGLRRLPALRGLAPSWPRWQGQDRRRRSVETARGQPEIAFRRRPPTRPL